MNLDEVTLAELPQQNGPSPARWKAFHIGYHSADLCDACARTWQASWQENGGTVDVRKRPTMILRKTPSRVKS